MLPVPSALLLAALCTVESGNNVYAIKHDASGRAHYGVLQISEAVVEDVNEWNKSQGIKKRYRHRDCLRMEPSVEIFHAYCARYAKDGWTDKEFALLWHLGPKGMKRPGMRGAVYWAQAEVVMDSMRPETPKLAPVISLP